MALLEFGTVKRPFVRNGRLVLVLVLGASLAACAEEESGPQFANEPAPTRPATEIPMAASPMPGRATPVAATPGAATPVSIANLLATRGAPTRLFVTVNNVIWAVSSSGESEPVYTAAPGERVAAIDAAPGGERVAAVLETTVTEGERTDVAIFDSTGETVARLDNLGAASATPMPARESTTAEAIDWSPQADQALVSFRDGAIVAFQIGSDEARTLLPPAVDGVSRVSPRWSPTGEAVAFITASENGRARMLQVLDVRDGSVTDVVAPPQGRFVVDYAWMPNGVSLLFTEGGELGGAVTGIDLWRVDANGENRELVVSAGTVAPVARITNVQPSPDGRSVAYAVLVPGDSEPRVDSIWVREIASRLGFRIQIPSVAAVDDITWTDEGLAIAVATGGAGSGRPPTLALLQVNQGGGVSALWAAPIVGATPVGGAPIATPEAS